MSLYLLKLPGFHKLALLQRDLGMSGRSHGYRSGSVHRPGLPAARRGSIKPLGRILAQHSGLNPGFFYQFLFLENRKVSYDLQFADNYRKVIVGAQCLAPKKGVQ